MIKRFEGGARRGSWLGAALLAGLGWVGFTHGAIATVPGGEPPPAQDPEAELERIAVVRPQEPPAWRAALEAALERPHDFAFEATPASEVLQAVQQATGVNVLLRPPSLIEDHGDPPISLHVEATPLGEVLALIGRSLRGARVSLSREAIALRDGVGEDELEPRFYRIAPLCEEIGDCDEMGDGLCDLVRAFADPANTEIWDSGASISYWNGLLTVSQTPEMHARVEAFLNRLLNRGAQPKAAVPAWRARIAAILQRPATVDADGVETGVVLARLGEEHGVSLSIEEDRSAEPITLALRDVTLGAVLAWIAEQHGVGVHVAHGAVWLGGGAPPCELEFFDVRPLLAATADLDRDEVRERVAELIRSQVVPEAWDDWARLEFWQDLLLVYAPAAANQRIGQLLSALGRALAH